MMEYTATQAMNFVNVFVKDDTSETDNKSAALEWVETFKPFIEVFQKLIVPKDLQFEYGGMEEAMIFGFTDKSLLLVAKKDNNFGPIVITPDDDEYDFFCASLLMLARQEINL